MQLLVVLLLILMAYLFLPTLFPGISIEGFAKVREQDLSYSQMQSWDGFKRGYGEQTPPLVKVQANIATNAIPVLKPPQEIIENLGETFDITRAEPVPHMRYRDLPPV